MRSLRHNIGAAISDSPCVLLVLFVWAACRVDNPDFDQSEDSVDTSTADTEDPTVSDPNATTASGGEDSTQNDNSSGATDTQNETDSTDESSTKTGTTDTTDLTDSTGTSSEDTDKSSSSTDSTDSSTDSGETNDYCARGAWSCYKMNDIVEGQFLDNGISMIPVDLSAVTVSAFGTKPFPLDTVAVFTTESEASRSAAIHVATSPILAIDMWLLPDDDAPAEWTAAQAGTHLRIGRGSDGDIKCEGIEVVTRLTLSHTASFDSELQHFACGYDGERLILWVNGAERSSQSMTANSFTSLNFTIGNDTPGGSDRPFKGRIGALRIWKDIEAMTAAFALEATEFGR